MFPSAASVGAQSPQPFASRITVESQVMALVGPGTAGLPKAAAPGSVVRRSAARAHQRLAPGLPVERLFERILRPPVPRAGRAEPAPPALPRLAARVRPNAAAHNVGQEILRRSIRAAESVPSLPGVSRPP